MVLPDLYTVDVSARSWARHCGQDLLQARESPVRCHRYCIGLQGCLLLLLLLLLLLRLLNAVLGQLFRCCCCWCLPWRVAC
jgi:hypothetical protein